MIGPERVYAARMMGWPKWAGGRVWKITLRDGTVSCEKQSSLFPERPTHVWIRKRGTVKIPKTATVELLGPVLRPDSYTKIYEYVKLYGVAATVNLLGFDEASYGDQYPIREIEMFDNLGQHYCDWLEQIALIDGQIGDYFIRHGVTFSHFGSYDMWMKSEKLGHYEDGSPRYEAAFRQSPFLATYIQLCILGVIPLQWPLLRTGRWIENLRTLVRKFTPQHKQVTRDLTMIGRICSKDSAKWIHENIVLTGPTTFRPEIKFDWSINDGTDTNENADASESSDT